MIQLAAQTLESFFTGGGNAREHAEYPLDEVRLLAPVQRPPSVRDFYAFEEHVRNARAVTGRGEVVPEWYEIPVFYFSNPAAIYGPEDEIPYPEGSEALDYELEVAAVIGAGRADRRLHGHERLVGARPPAPGDEGRPRPCEGQGLRHLARAGARHAGRARRPAPGDGRARERRGALAREPRRHLPLVGVDPGPRLAQHRAAAGRRARLGHRRHRLHPRARRRALAAARRRGRARGRGDRRPAQPNRHDRR